MYHSPPPSHLYDNQRQYNVLSEPSQISPTPDAGLSSSHRSRDHALPDELANTFHSGSAHNGFERASHYYAFPGANPTHSLTRRNLDEHNRLNEGINPSSRQLQNAPSQAYRGSDNRGFYKYKAAAPSASDGPARPSSAMAVIGSAYEGRPRMNAGMGGFGPDRFSQFLRPPGDAPSPVPAPPLPQQPRQFPLTRPNSRFTDRNQDKTRAMVEAFRAMQNEQDQERQRKWNAEHNIREEFKSDNMGMDQKRPPSQGSVQSNRSRAVTVISTSDEDDWTTGRRVTSMYNKPIAPELRSNMEGGSTSNTGGSRNEHAEKAALEAHARALEEARKLSEGEIDEEDDESVQRYVRSKFGVQIEDYNTESEMESSTDESTTTSESNREDPQPTINAAMMAHARALEAARKLAEGSLDDDDDDETSLQRYVRLKSGDQASDEVSAPGSQFSAKKSNHDSGKGVETQVLMLEMEKKSSVNWGDEPAADTQQERYQHNVATIDHTMSLSEVTQHLVNRACPDITQNIDLQRCTRSPIAGGGFGDIYRGSLVDGTEVAIKCSRVFVGSDDESQKKLKRAARELYAWSKFKHENVLDLLGLALFRGEIAMVSPWMENGDIIAYLLKKPDSNRYSLSGQVAEGLVYLHKLGTIHGDLKGLNVLVAHDGTAKLTDFGNVVSEHHSLRFTTTKANPSHSLRWTAPELLLDEGTFSIKADVYALGMTILEIITGKPPYSGKTDPAVIVFVTLKKKTPARPEDCIPSNSIQGDRLWTTLTLCWSPDPEARPEAAEIRDVMKQMTHEGI